MDVKLQNFFVKCNITKKVYCCIFQPEIFCKITSIAKKKSPAAPGPRANYFLLWMLSYRKFPAEICKITRFCGIVFCDCTFLHVFSQFWRRRRKKNFRLRRHFLRVHYFYKKCNIALFFCNFAILQKKCNIAFFSPKNCVK